MLLALTCLGLAAAAHAQTNSKATLDSSETVFTVLAAINRCGYDQELAASDPVRDAIRREVDIAADATPAAADVSRSMCGFYHDHRPDDPARNLAQYVSLALNLNAAPALTPKLKEADLPPDAGYVVGFAPLVKQFYDQTKLHDIWLRHRPEYEKLVDGYHEPLQKLIFTTDIYFRLPLSGYQNSQFVILIEPLGAPSQANARNYGTDYTVVVSPTATELKLDQIKHTYLHYLLDDLASHHFSSLKRLEPMLESVRSAPMEESFKGDIALLVTESLIRAVEARTSGDKKVPEEIRQQAVNSAVKEGFVLTRYFYDQLPAFEKGDIGLRQAYAPMLDAINVDVQRKFAATLQFSGKPAPDVVSLGSKPGRDILLVTAERRLGEGDPGAADRLAQQALETKQGDPGRAWFIRAQAASVSRKMDEAIEGFEKTLQSTQEIRLVGWSHVYLGRILDLREEREDAVKHYQAALIAADTIPEIRAAAQRGLDHPYEPPQSAQKDRKPEEKDKEKDKEKK